MSLPKLLDSNSVCTILNPSLKKKKKLRRRVRVLDMLYSGQMSSFLSQDLFAFGQNGLGQAQFCTWEWQNRKGLVVFH